MKPVLAFQCLMLVGLVIAASTVSSPRLAKEAVPPRRVFCDEVAHELNLAFLDGRINGGDAIKIIDRCYELYR